MKAYWQRYVSWFYGLQPRERLILAGAAIGGIVLLGNSLFVDPALLRGQKARQQIAQLPAATQALQVQTQVLVKQMNDPDLAMKAELARLSAQFAEQAQRLHTVERSLITPAEMVDLLESLLTKARGVELIGLHTLAPQSVTQEASAKGVEKPAEASVATASAAAASQTTAAHLYRHGIELEVAGSYLDLLAYLKALESDAPNIIWGRLELDAEHYPRTVMKVTAYTLSIDRSWLAL